MRSRNWIFSLERTLISHYSRKSETSTPFPFVFLGLSRTSYSLSASFCFSRWRRISVNSTLQCEFNRCSKDFVKKKRSLNLRASDLKVRFQLSEACVRTKEINVATIYEWVLLTYFYTSIAMLSFALKSTKNTKNYTSRFSITMTGSATRKNSHKNHTSAYRERASFSYIEKHAASLRILYITYTSDHYRTRQKAQYK